MTSKRNFLISLSAAVMAVRSTQLPWPCSCRSYKTAAGSKLSSASRQITQLHLQGGQLVWVSVSCNFLIMSFHRDIETTLAHSLLVWRKKKKILKSCKFKCTVHNSARSISVWLNRHNIKHSSMSKLWSSVLLSMAPLCRCHLRNNRNAHPLQSSLPPQRKARTDCWRMDWSVRGRGQRVNDNQWGKEKERKNKTNGRGTERRKREW